MTESKKPKILVLSGLGINCESETSFAFEMAAKELQIPVNCNLTHVNEINDSLLFSHDILALPGGFSYGDHTGAGNALSIKIKQKLQSSIQDFASKGGMVIGICNGCQVILKSTTQDVIVTYNSDHQYNCSWTDLEVKCKNNVWLDSIKNIKLPIANAEGRFKIKTSIPEGWSIAMKYSNNPNGSDNDIAALSDQTGRILAMMPHPERAVLFTQLENWNKSYKSGKEEHSGPGLQIFKNALLHASKNL